MRRKEGYDVVVYVLFDEVVLLFLNSSVMRDPVENLVASHF